MESMLRSFLVLQLTLFFGIYFGRIKCHPGFSSYPMRSAGRSGQTGTVCSLLRRDSATTGTGNLRYGQDGLLSPLWCRLVGPTKSIRKIFSITAIPQEVRLSNLFAARLACIGAGVS